METLQIRDAKAGFSAVIAAAERGEPTVTSRHGRPCAMVVPIADGQRLYPLDQPSLARYLLSMPDPVEFADALPKSGSGKVMWRRLQEKEQRGG